MSWILRKKYVVAMMGCLATGWLVMVVNAEDRQSAKKPQFSQPIAKSPAEKAKPGVILQEKDDKQYFLPALTQFEKHFQEKLNETIDEEYIDTPLEDVIKHFQESLGLSFVVSRKALDEEGISLEDPITISLPKISNQSALDLILKPLDLTYVVERDFVLITTKYNAQEMLKTRVYPVGDYCKTPDDYLALELAIKNASVGKWRYPKTNAGGGGTGGGFFQVSPQAIRMQAPPPVYAEGNGGTISVVLPSKSLVISQTYQAHEKIVELLNQLRQARYYEL
ncbi:hypothetical protein [uncultured Gimesia sp.]|uniref:hypothetical protein n=1 Tax=uncultured Gimesia sp. TaxID=1678688 RepID=UPI002635143B|nr:hypothetical protein [uncultured Gimesia sp.]